MQNKTTLQTPNEILTANEPWHRGSGFTWMLLALAGLVFFLSGAVAKAETVSYNMATGNFTTRTQNTGLGDNGDPFAGANNPGGSTTEIEHYANSTWGPEVAVASFRTLTGSASGGSARDLKVGDVFTITGYVGSNPNAAGTIGISFNDGTSSSVFSNYNSGSLAQFVIFDGGAWKVNSNSGISEATGLGAGADRTFTLKVTSDRTFSATIGNQDFYDLTFSGGSAATIDSFALWSTVGSDGNGWKTDNPNSYWKNASIQNSGSVELGYAAGAGVTRSFSGVISDGQALSSASTTANAVFIGGDSGSQVNLSGNNTYTGLTTINANATAEAQHANAFGSTSAGTTITGGGVLKLYDASGISYAAEALTVNGTGISDAGALRNVGGNNTWAGAVTLGSNSRISSDEGSLTLSGGISGGSNVLYVGGANATTVSSAISGAGASQDGTTTSLFKDGAGTLTLTGNNSYSGDTRITAGTLTVNSGGNLGDGSSDIYVSSGATLNVNANTTVASLQETGTGNGGTASIGSGATLTINQTSETKYFNALTGEGSLAKSGAGRLSVYGTSSKSGANTVSGGVLEVQSGASLAGATTINDGGTLDAEGTLSGAVTVNSGGTVEGSGSVGALTIASGGTLNPGNSPGTLTAASAIWEGGGHYAWEINDWTGAQGTNWDFLNITGTLLISATTSDFIIDVISLLADNSLGNVPNFAETSTYTFAIATAAGGITGFNADYFTINASGFSNPDAGTWGIAKDGNTINLVYTGSQATAIPEPSSVSLFVFGMAAVLAKRRRVARG